MTSAQEQPSAELAQRLARIKLLILDVDGVLTDGRLVYASDGTEQKAFHVRDGAAIKQMMRSGLQLGIITGRRSTMVERRAQELGVTALMQGADNKFDAFRALKAATPEWQSLPLEACACIGDDLADLDLYEHFGLRLTVADGHPLVKARADWSTNLNGGAGVLREVAELLLRARGQWPEP